MKHNTSKRTIQLLQFEQGLRTGADDFAWRAGSFLRAIGMAGLSKFRARLEALLRGPTQWPVQKLEGGHQIIVIEIISYVKIQGPERVMPS